MGAGGVGPHPKMGLKIRDNPNEIFRNRLAHFPYCSENAFERREASPQFAPYGVAQNLRLGFEQSCLPVPHAAERIPTSASCPTDYVQSLSSAEMVSFQTIS